MLNSPDLHSMNSARNSCPPMNPSPLRKDSTLPSLQVEHVDDLEARGLHPFTHPSAPMSGSVTPVVYGDYITTSPTLGNSMASTGLQLDLGLRDTFSWSCPPQLMHDSTTPSSTISSTSVHRRSSFAFSDHCSYDPLSTPMYQDSDNFQYSNANFLPTPAASCKDLSFAFGGDIIWNSTEQPFYEPCHLALSEGEEPPGDAPIPWSAAMETSSQQPMPQIHSATLDAIPKREDTTSLDYRPRLSIDTSEAPSTRECSVQASGEAKRTKRRLTRPEDVKLRCPVCSKGFARTFNYNTHLQIHNPQRRRPCRCAHSGCDKDFFRITDLKRHVQSVSACSVRRLIQMLICLQVHVKCKAFECRDCLARFPRKDSLQRHLTDGCVRRTAVEKRTMKVQRQEQRRHRHGSSQGLDGAVEDLRMGSTDVDESEYTTRTDVLKLLRDSREPSASREDGQVGHLVSR